MLKRFVNEARFTLRITTTGPLLIRSGYETIEGANMAPVLTFRNGQQEIFLPGSSLKGVFRSHIERIIRSLKPGIACHPFKDEKKQEGELQKQWQGDYRKSCSWIFTQRSNDERKELEAHTDQIYQKCCPVCRLFGSMGFIGRIAIGDAYLASKSILEYRDGVGIDRLTGGASHSAKFQLQVISPGVDFETDIQLRNFEIWQLGMLFVILQDLKDELVQMGSGRSRGLGKVKAEIVLREGNGRPGGITISTIRGHAEPEHELWGLGRWLDDGSYGTKTDDLLILAPPIKQQDRGIRSQRIFTDEPLTTLCDTSIAYFIKRMQEWEPANEAAIAASKGG